MNKREASQEFGKQTSKLRSHTVKLIARGEGVCGPRYKIRDKATNENARSLYREKRKF